MSEKPTCRLVIGNMSIDIYNKYFNRLQKFVWKTLLGVEIVDY